MIQLNEICKENYNKRLRTVVKKIQWKMFIDSFFYNRFKLKLYLTDYVEFSSRITTFSFYSTFCKILFNFKF